MSKGSHRNRLLPDIPYDSAEVVNSFALDAARDDHLRLIYFGGEARPSFFATLYFGCASFQSRSCVGKRYLISDHSCSAFIPLIQANRTSAAFSLLTMYSTRHRTLTDYPDSFRKLFSELSDSDRHSHGIGKLTFPSPSPLQLMKTHRGPILIEPTHSNKIPHPFYLEPTSRRVR